MKPNHHLILPIVSVLLLFILNTCIALRQNDQRRQLLNLVRLQDETIFSAIEYMANPSDTACKNDFLRSYEESEKAWLELHPLIETN